MHYKVEFKEGPETATGPSATAQMTTCWICDCSLVTFDLSDGPFVCGPCHDELFRKEPHLTLVPKTEDGK